MSTQQHRDTEFDDANWAHLWAILTSAPKSDIAAARAKLIELQTKRLGPWRETQVREYRKVG